MCTNLHSFYIFILSFQPIFSFFNVCHTHQNNILNNDECLDLYFETNDKATQLGDVKLEVDQNSLKIIPAHLLWTSSFLKISKTNQTIAPLCSKLTTSEKYYCFSYTPDMQNETFQLEYKTEKLPDINFRRFTFTLPKWDEAPLFLYVDQTDFSKLILKSQKISPSNISYYKVEAFKEKNGNTNLQDFQHFSNNDEITFQLFTYSDVGNYDFVVSGINRTCPEGVCFKIKTPTIFIGRKSTRVVIGIVGASFILPFILFVFHILTKKYPAEQDKSKVDEKVVLIYKSSTNKHNEVVLTMAALLEELVKSKLEVIDVSKTSKFTEKFCNDLFIVANYIIYVPPPKQDPNPVVINKLFTHNNIFCLTFEHCTEELPDVLKKNKFKMFEELDGFMEALQLPKPINENLLHDLIAKTEEAKAETDLNTNILPKIVITESEPQEYDSLISKSLL